MKSIIISNIKKRRNVSLGNWIKNEEEDLTYIIYNKNKSMANNKSESSKNVNDRTIYF